jgi:TPR repeat protein
LEAVKWYRLAAEQGQADAQYQLGMSDSFGNGVPQDHVLFHMWCNLAASSATAANPELYAERRGDAEASITREQVAEAQCLAHEWKPKTWEELQPAE